MTTEVGGGAGAMPGSPVAISANGRYVVFVSRGSVVTRDRRIGRQTVASVRPDGAPPDGPSGEIPGEPYYFPVGISGDGRFVAFTSWAGHLVPGRVGGFAARVFVRDLRAGVTTELGDGDFAAISADGHSNALLDGEGLEVRYLAARTTISVTSDSVSAVSLSVDGRFVAFSSRATDLVPGDTNGREDVLVHDLATGVTSLVSVARTGGPANGTSSTPAISANGRYVAFESDASNLVRGDEDWFGDVFVRDLVTGRTTRVSLASSGAEGWDPGSCDGVGGFDDNDVAISADGRLVVFTSCLQDLVRGEDNYKSDVFVRDRRRGVTSLVSVARTGGGGNGPSGGAIAISAHGRVVAFGSGATNLVTRPTRGWGVFVRDRLASRW